MTFANGMLAPALAAALKKVPRDNDNARRVGVSLKTMFGEKGCGPWLDWIEPEDEQAAREQWRALNPHAEAGSETIYRLAMRGGWDGEPAKDAFSDAALQALRSEQERVTDQVIATQAAEHQAKG